MSSRSFRINRGSDRRPTMSQVPQKRRSRLARSRGDIEALYPIVLILEAKTVWMGKNRVNADSDNQDGKTCLNWT